MCEPSVCVNTEYSRMCYDKMRCVAVDIVIVVVVVVVVVVTSHHSSQIEFSHALASFYSCRVSTIPSFIHIA